MTIHVTPIPRLTTLTTPAFLLGTANAAGDAITAVASNSTLLAFDAVAPAQVGAASAVGSATVSTRRDHVHQAGSGSGKWWAKWAGNSTTLEASYNVTSVSDDGTGDSTVTIATDFSSGEWMATGGFDQAAGGQILYIAAQAAGTQRYLCKNLAGSLSSRDPTSFFGGGWGDQ